MKKKLFSLFCMSMCLGMMVSILTSCQQDEDILATPKNEVQIYLSVPESSSATDLRSATTGDQAVKEGDTIDVWNLRDINLIISAEDKLGIGIDGMWSICNSDNDQKYGIFLANNGYPAKVEEANATSIKLSRLGLYGVVFTPKNSLYAQFIFYIRHLGTPGEFGDTWSNSCAFRLERLINCQLSTDEGYKPHEGYTAYIRYREGDFPKMDPNYQVDPSQPENFHAFVFGGKEAYYQNNGHEFAYGKKYNLRKCKYSPGYYCFNFLSEDFPDNDRYQIIFYSGLLGEDWWLFPLVNDSDWKQKETSYITFMSL
jgi:hypothetical protein